MPETAWTGLLAIAFGADNADDFVPTTATIGKLGDLTAAAGVKDGVIEVSKGDADAGERIKEAFRDAFLIMGMLLPMRADPHKVEDHLSR